MVSRFVHMIIAAALAFVPGLTSAAIAAPAKHKNCAIKSHQHAKVAAAKPAPRPAGVGGGAGAQLRRSPDVQILSYGP
jgi:hypothetical protein